MILILSTFFQVSISIFLIFFRLWLDKVILICKVSLALHFFNPLKYLTVTIFSWLKEFIIILKGH